MPSTNRFKSPLLLLIVSLSTLQYSCAFLPPITGLSIDEEQPLASHSSTLNNQLNMKPSASAANFQIQWKVRPATPDDEEAVTELLTASYSTLLLDDYDSKILEEALPLITTPRPHLLTCGTWYVVESNSCNQDDPLLVGCGGWTRENPSTRNHEGHSHLRHFATHPDFLRKGVGRALWNQVLEDIMTDKEDNMIPTLEVYSTLTAQPFYESLGFRSVEPIYIPIPLTVSCKFPSVIMRQELSG